MKKILAFILKHQKFFMALSFFGILWPIYVMINQLAVAYDFPKNSAENSLDGMIPFVPEWIFIYSSMYSIALLPFIYIKNDFLYRRMWFSFCLTGLIAYVVFLIYPVFNTLRPAANPVDFSRFFLSLDNSHDTPYNCMPSLHVAYSMMAGFWTYFVDKSKVGIAVLIWGCLIAVSVVFVKEHYIEDLIYGVVLAWLLFYLFSRDLKKRLPQPPILWKKGVIWLVIPLGLYVVKMAFVSFKYFEHINGIAWCQSSSISQIYFRLYSGVIL